MTTLTKCSVCGWEWDGNAQCDHKYGLISDEELYTNVSTDYESPPKDPLIDELHNIWSSTKNNWEQELNILFDLTKIKTNNIPIIDNYMTLFSLRSGQIQEELKAWIYHYGTDNYLMTEFNTMRETIEYYLDQLSKL